MRHAHLSDQAKADLVQIWCFIAEDNETAADRLISLIHRKCRLIAASPGIGRTRPELDPELRSFPIGNYLVFYREIEGGIEVARVLSGFRDLPTLLGRA